MNCLNQISQNMSRQVNWMEFVHIKTKYFCKVPYLIKSYQTTYHLIIPSGVRLTTNENISTYVIFNV